MAALRLAFSFLPADWPPVIRAAVFHVHRSISGDYRWRWWSMDHGQVHLRFQIRGIHGDNVLVENGRVRLFRQDGNEINYCWRFDAESGLFTQVTAQLLSNVRTEITVFTREVLVAMVHLKRARRRRAVCMLRQLFRDLGPLVWKYVK